MSRILNRPDSTVGKVLKARYFNRGTILNAKVGFSLSFTWRSLLCGRDLLKKGLGWVVGDGASIKVWEDKWLIGNRSKLVDVSGNEDAGMLVKDLIQPDDHR